MGEFKKRISAIDDERNWAIGEFVTTDDFFKILDEAKREFPFLAHVHGEEVVVASPSVRKWFEKWFGES